MRLLKRFLEKVEYTVYIELWVLIMFHGLTLVSYRHMSTIAMSFMQPNSSQLWEETKEQLERIMGMESQGDEVYRKEEEEKETKVRKRKF